VHESSLQDLFIVSAYAPILRLSGKLERKPNWPYESSERPSDLIYGRTRPNPASASPQTQKHARRWRDTSTTYPKMIVAFRRCPDYLPATTITITISSPLTSLHGIFHHQGEFPQPTTANVQRPITAHAFTTPPSHVGLLLLRSRPMS